MKKYISFILASLLLLAFFSSSAFAMAARANPGTKVFGIGEIEEGFFEILLDEDLGMPMGLLGFADYPNQKFVAGEITSVTVVSSSKVNFSGSYITPADNVSHTFQAVAEDLGKPGDGIDRFSIILSDGYTKSNTLALGEIEIIQ